MHVMLLLYLKIIQLKENILLFLFVIINVMIYYNQSFQLIQFSKLNNMNHAGDKCFRRILHVRLFHNAWQTNTVLWLLDNYINVL